MSSLNGLVPIGLIEFLPVSILKTIDVHEHVLQKEGFCTKMAIFKKLQNSFLSPPDLLFVQS